MRGISFGEGRFIYVPLPKVACTSIKHALHKLEGSDEIDQDNIHVFFEGKLEGILGKERVFLIVRDPVKRFLSAYGNRVGYHYELSRRHIENNYPRLVKKIKIFNPGIGQFIDDLDVYLKVSAIEHHVMPVSKILGVKNLNGISDIYPIERISCFENEIKSITEKNFEIERRQTQGRKIHLKDLSRAQVEKLVDFYKDDYKILNDYYSVDALWREWSEDKNSSFVYNRNKIKSDSSSGAPFIIWTLRRTGGTNLSSALFESSKFSSIQHEPYNKNRMFGEVQKNWLELQDPQRLERQMASTLKDRPLIKHCVEMVPLAVNMALMYEAIRKGYRHLFLYREEAKDRLLSLNFSRLTNVWGREEMPKEGLPSHVFDQDIPVGELISHEEHCRETLRRLFYALDDKGEAVESISFEQLYVGSESEAKDKLSSLVSFLELNEGYFTEEKVASILKRGGQGTKGDYLKFGGVMDFAERVAKLPPFSLETNTVPALERFDVRKRFRHCEVWDIAHKRDAIVLSGVLLADEPVLLWAEKDDGSELYFDQGLESPRIGLLYPDVKGAGQCRFESQKIAFLCGIKLMAQVGGEKILLAEVYRRYASK